MHVVLFPSSINDNPPVFADEHVYIPRIPHFEREEQSKATKELHVLEGAFLF